MTHILSLILWTPAVGALIAALTPEYYSRAIRGVALTAMLLAFAMSWFLLLGFEGGETGAQFAELLPWNPELGSSYALGVDGFSLPMVLLATLLSLIACFASFSQKQRVKGYHVCLLMLETGMLGVFMAQDWVLFYVFWEITLIPLFFLIDQWGGKHRHTASLNFVLYTMGGSVFMLIGLLMVYTASATHSTAMQAMARAAAEMPLAQQRLVFLGLFIGFGVKMPVFPLHGWLPLAHVEAPSPVSILLSGVLLKMGAYGILRAAGMTPLALRELQPLLAGLALVGIVYGGLLAWRQSDLKAMIAYSSVSHMGVVLLGISTLNPVGLLGAALQMSAHGLIAALLFLLVGLLYQRAHTREVSAYGSVARSLPRFALFLSLALLASLGLPGAAGFVAELHVLIGGFQQWGWWTALLSVGVIISAAYALRTLGYVFSGPAQADMQGLEDLRGCELVAASALAAGILALGLAPAAALELSSAAAAQLSASAAVQPAEDWR
jgi:NADH-quinone oxidoreductase subunit M